MSDANSRTEKSDLNPSTVAIKSLVIIANPRAGGFRPGLISDIVEELARRDVLAQVHLTKGAGDIRRLARDQNFRADALAVYGGDGSINEAVSGLHERQGQRPPLIVIPGGTANVLACELNLPRKAKEIADSIVKSATAPLYYALANQQPFFLMASVGVDAQAVHGVSPKLKKYFGRLAFILSAFAAVWRHDTPDIRVEGPDSVLSRRLVVIAKARCYGGRYAISQQASVHRPGLRLIALSKDGLIHLLRLGAGLLRGRNITDGNVIDIAVQTIVLTSDLPAPVQIDGEAFGFTPVKIEPVLEPLRILVP